MKISQISITDFHQFKDVTIDLTYPKGHEKEGKPLDKVCFIGQSGTGKTTLLELIPKFLYKYNTQLILKCGEASIIDRIIFIIEFGIDDVCSATITYVKNPDQPSSHPFARRWSNNEYNNQEVNDKSVGEFYTNSWIKEIATYPSHQVHIVQYSKSP